MEKLLTVNSASCGGSISDEKGFTLIETVIVMVIAVILATVVAVRWSPFDTIKLNSATRKVAADIRYAQKLAISSQQRCGVVFSGSTYTVFEKGDTADPAPSSGDTCSTDSSNNFIVDFNADRCSNYSGVTVSTITIAFNSIGTPVDSPPDAPNPAGTQIVTVTYKTGKDITIDAGTGRVSYE